MVLSTHVLQGTLYGFAIMFLLASILQGEQLDVIDPIDGMRVTSPETVDGATDLDVTDIGRIDVAVLIDYDDPNDADFYELYEGSESELSLFNYQWQLNEPLDPAYATGYWVVEGRIDSGVEDKHDGPTGPMGPA